MKLGSILGRWCWTTHVYLEMGLSSLKEFCFSLWDQHKPKTYRQARNHIASSIEEDPLTDPTVASPTLMVYFTHWRKKEGLSKPRPHRRKKKKADE